MLKQLSCLNNFSYSFQETQVEHLVEAGFSKNSITTSIIDNQPPKNCEYYATSKMIAPIVIKQ